MVSDIACAGKVVNLKFKAFDQAKDEEFINCLTGAGVRFERVEVGAVDVEIVFASNLDMPIPSDARGLSQAADSTATTVLVEYLAVQHAPLFAQWTAFCLDEVVAAKVAAELAVVLIAKE